MLFRFCDLLFVVAILGSRRQTFAQDSGHKQPQWQRQSASPWADDGSLPSGPPAHMPRVTRVDVVCGKQHMTVQLEFNQPFHGIVFSKGKFSETHCVYVPANTGLSRYTFDVRYDACGTKPDLHGNFYENTVVIQYGADLIEAWDEAKRLRCEWHEAYEKSAAGPPPIQLADLDVVELNFQGDSIDCWMEIQEGKGPWSREVSGLVPLGSPLTMVVAINDAEGQFDMRVKSCFAHDGRSVPVQLTDEWGCVLRPKLLSPFAKVRDYNGRATVVSYSHFYAFKFPDTMDVHVQCKVEVCRHGCPDSCQKVQYQPSSHHSVDINSLDVSPLESKKVIVKATTRTQQSSQLKESIQAAESRPPPKSQPEENFVSTEEHEEVPVPEPIPGEGQPGRIVPPKAAQLHYQEIKTSTNQLVQHLEKIQGTHNDVHKYQSVGNSDYPNNLPVRSHSFEQNVESTDVVPEVAVPVPEPEPQASFFQPVAEPLPASSVQKPVVQSIQTSSAPFGIDQKQGQLFLGKNPRSDAKAHALFQDHPSDVSPHKQAQQRFNPPVLYKPPKPYYPYPIPQFVPPQPLFVKVTDRSDSQSSIIYRQPENVPPEIYLNRRADPAPVPFHQPRGASPHPQPPIGIKFNFPQGPRSIRLRRSAQDGEEIGVQQVYRAVASVDLAFEPNATLDNTAVYSGRKEEVVYGVCLPALSLTVGLGFLLLMTVLSLCVCAYMAYQFRLQAMLKNSQTCLTTKQQPGGAFYFLYRNRAATSSRSQK